MIFEIYLIGVMINFIIVIMIFLDKEFNIINRKNKLLAINDKIVLLAICFLSWVLIIHSLIKNNRK